MGITKRALAAAMASSESKVSTPSASKVAEGASKVVDSASAVQRTTATPTGSVPLFLRMRQGGGVQVHRFLRAGPAEGREAFRPPDRGAFGAVHACLHGRSQGGSRGS